MNTVVKHVFKSASAKIYWKETLALVIVLLAIVFFRSERKELSDIIPQIRAADPAWLIFAAIITATSILFQAGMYRQSFAAISFPLNWRGSLELFLKRNFLSVFLPAGGVSALAYSPPQIRKAGFTKLQINQASGLFGFAGLATVFLVAVPVMYSSLLNGQFANSAVGLMVLFVILLSLFVSVRSLRKKGILYKWVNKRFPSVSAVLDELLSVNVSSKHFTGVLVYSIGVEFCGMMHVYVCMLALGFHASFAAAAATYVLSVLITIISPFLKGLGAVELTMMYVLEKFGYSSSQALSATILYRVFEFWLPLATGLIAFAWKGKNLFLRVAPAILTFSLGLINIISAVTSPVHYRLKLLRDYIPLSAIHASHLLVVFTGLFLLVTSAFLFRGLRNAWIIALILSVLSFIGHLGKALDYEEAIAAAFTAVVLILTVSQYRIRSNYKWMKAGLKIAILNLAAVLLFGIIGFYSIDIKHFGIDFTWRQSLEHTLKIFLLTEDDSLHPITLFGAEFLSFIRVLGFITWGFLLFTLIKPGLKRNIASENFRERARFLLSQFGKSSNDYFKTYKDKLLFFSDIHDAFLAYRIAGGFAIVLEDPVCAEENKLQVLAEFEHHCRKMGLKPAFYRVDENSIPWFNSLRKRKLMIGQEAILEIRDFTLEGKDKKSLRNGLNGLRSKGYVTTVHTPPHTVGFMSQLKKVSDDWLTSFQKQEFIFSQGMFDQAELQQQDIITVEDHEGNIKAFLNIIPDYAADECTYDLIRKTTDAPAAAMDALIVKLVEYAKEQNKLYLNLGLVPMTGISQPENTAEQILKLAADKIKRFQRYKGLREFKGKYATMWENKYLIYENDFDLLQLPLALKTVMKP